MNPGAASRTPHNRAAFDSFSVKRRVGRPSDRRVSSPNSWLVTRISAAPVRVRRGRGVSWSQDEVFRNTAWGSTNSGAASGPRLCAVIRMRMSPGDALAYSTTTSKYRSSSNTPVSRSSNSGSSALRRAFSSTSRVYGCPLGVLVEHPKVGMRRRCVEVVVELLDVLSVIPLGIRQPEQPFLQNRVASVPQTE